MLLVIVAVVKFIFSNMNFEIVTIRITIWSYDFSALLLYTALRTAQFASVFAADPVV
jgi:hypothetical protein